MAYACISCMSVDLVKKTKDVMVPVGASLQIHPVSGWHCPHCGAVMLLGDAGSSLEGNESRRQLAEAISKQGEFIREVRESLCLTQKEAGEILGGKEVAFRQYEQMEAIPPRAVIHLLRILRKHPELWDEIRSYC